MRVRALALLALTAAPLAAVGLAPSPVTAAPRAVVASFPASDEAERLLTDYLNAERATRGLQTLTRVPALDGYARTWSTFMAGGGCVARDGRRLCHRADLKVVADTSAPNGWTRAGENVGLVPNGGSIKELHDAFVASPAHLANIVQKDYNAIGVGVSYDADGTLFVTYEFLSTMGSPIGTTTDPYADLPPLPPGLSPADQLFFYVNDARVKAGLAPLTRSPVLDREATTWSTALASSVCGGNTMLCHRKDLSAVAKAAVGTGNAKWWSENVGVRLPASVQNQFVGFMNSAGHRANILRPDINFGGIGYAIDGSGKAFTTFEFVAARDVAKVRPPSGSPCGWLQATIRSGAKGVQVRVAQCALTDAGVYSGPIDGTFGPTVVAAVKAFQTRNAIKVTGILDLKTRKALGVA